VKEQEVDARFADGVLKITLPKTVRVAPRQIEVKG
jgi:HSP20 family molecular chaperone IbpA